jgi:hypothetical protein
LTKQSAAQRLALPHPFFADARFWGARLSDKPITVAFWRVAPSVRLSAFAILATGSLRAMDLRTRTSLLDHGLRIGPVFFRTIALATFAPTQKTLRQLLISIRRLQSIANPETKSSEAAQKRAPTSFSQVVDSALDGDEPAMQASARCRYAVMIGVRDPLPSAGSPRRRRWLLDEAGSAAVFCAASVQSDSPGPHLGPFGTTPSKPKPCLLQRLRNLASLSRPPGTLLTSHSTSTRRFPRGDRVRQCLPRRAALPTRRGSSPRPKSVDASRVGSP